MTPLLRKLHKWTGLLIGVQFLLWLASGLVMSVFDRDAVAGKPHRAAAPAVVAWPAEGLLAPGDVLAKAGQPVVSIDSVWLAGQPAYRLKGDGAVWLVDARSGVRLTVGAGEALHVALADYRGDGKAGAPRLQEAPTLETRKHQDASWRVDFDDADATSIYVSAQDGRILERRNTMWRLFDIAWMLHIMDYNGREDINNTLVLAAALAGMWMALTGVWLVCTSVRLRELIPARWLPVCTVTVRDETGRQLACVSGRAGDSVFDALCRAGIRLPSNCGGGQSCGLCAVAVCHAAPRASSSDADHIPVHRLQQGHRLACGMVLERDIEIAVSHGAALLGSRSAVVERVALITPTLREIVLRPDLPAGEGFHPGSYVQIHIPGHEALRRSYSLALPAPLADGCVTLLVRRMADGKGSSYMHGLEAGDRVAFHGPFGDFALYGGANEKVFIGGGAGMAPLRAMIRALLAAGATERMHFWYGARGAHDVPYDAEFRELAARHPNFTMHVVLSEGEPDAVYPLRGMVHRQAHDAFLAGHPSVRDCDFYVCGPPAMLQATRAMLAQLGAQRVAFDDFGV